MDVRVRTIAVTRSQEFVVNQNARQTHHICLVKVIRNDRAKSSIFLHLMFWLRLLSQPITRLKQLHPESYTFLNGKMHEHGKN